ncbi:site-specific integrase [Pararhodobacter oceanensis]|uniref:Integrase n=1 Tax=Pararhodobacter oceanensis TaxID=2172121 RepID=A0A2T8HQP2_9RHOB|nr:site-specific integrase [Pararhodobacter oceanensis]PVH27723.1 integrase [Pararhodobacter oceanensis]
MARKINEENERIKRLYLAYLRDANRCDTVTVDRAADAILKFEASTGYKSFKRFHIEQVSAFKVKLNAATHHRTGKPLSKATISGVLRANKAFVLWLAGQPGYKSRISYSDAEYFNQNAKDARVAHAHRETPYPTLKQCRHAFDAMPLGSDIEKRDKALFAFLMITGARDGAISSLRLKRIDLIEGCVHQDGRDVRTKFSKTFTTYFLPVDPVYLECFTAWVHHLRDDLLFGHEDALFPPPQMERVNGQFAVTGLKREPYANAGAIRTAIKDAFVCAGLHPFVPHSFRKTLVRWADTHYPTREAFKAFSQNIGHDSALTTVSSYLPVSQERQAELIRG